MPHARKDRNPATPRILTTVRIPDPDLRSSILVTSGLAKNISKQEVRAWCEEGHIYDTRGGRQFFRRLQKLGLFTSRFGGQFPSSRKAERYND